MTVRYWPGVAEDEVDSLAPELTNESLWIDEREWRVLGDMEFAPSDVAFLLVAQPGWAAMLAHPCVAPAAAPGAGGATRPSAPSASARDQGGVGSTNSGHRGGLPGRG